MRYPIGYSVEIRIAANGPWIKMKQIAKSERTLAVADVEAINAKAGMKMAKVRPIYGEDK